MSKKSDILLGVIAGLAVGAVIGILVAPDKGSETRKNIKNKAKEFADDIKNKVDDFKSKFDKNAEEAEENEEV